MQLTIAFVQIITLLVIAWYTFEARKSRIAAERQLEHSQKMFEREWLPSVYPDLSRLGGSGLKLNAFNVSRAGCIVDQVYLRLAGDLEPKFYSVFIPIAGGASFSFDITDEFADYFRERVQRSLWGGKIQIAVGYRSCSTRFTSEWREYDAVVEGYWLKSATSTGFVSS